MIGNSEGSSYTQTYGPTTFTGLPNNWNQGSQSIQQSQQSSYYDSSYQHEQQHYQQSIIEQNNYKFPIFKLYDFGRNNRNDIVHFIFSFVGIPFTEKRIKQNEWNRVKNLIPIQQLPILRVNKQFKLYNLNVIVRYLAREFNLYGTGNYEHAIVDIILELTRQFQEIFFEQINKSTNVEQQKIFLTQFITDHATNYLNQLENSYEIFHYNGPFYLGSQISIADLIVYQTISYLIDIQPKLLDNYPNLQKARYCLEKYPQLTNYLNKKHFKIKQKRHATVPPTLRQVNHHQRHRSYDENKSSHYHHRQKSNEPTTPLQIKGEPKSSNNQSIEKRPTRSVQIIMEPKSRSSRSTEKNSMTPLQIKEELKLANIQSNEKYSIPPMQVNKEPKLFNTQSIDNSTTHSLLTTQESNISSIQSQEKEPISSSQIIDVIPSSLDVVEEKFPSAAN
ncbi:unnamed protein product [Rotaria sp. Silwood1]|nr:unnamed protein product [Rotaria sp. Silwood1]